MLKIIPCDYNVLYSVPNVLEYFYEVFNSKEFNLYVSSNNNILSGFIGISADFGAYLKTDNYDLTLFFFDENYKITTIHRNGFKTIITEEDIIYIDDQTNIESTLNLVKRDKLDNDGYNGYVSYMQYNPNNDVRCELQYQHMIHGNNIIYPYHIKHIDNVFIDKDYKLSVIPDKGLMLFSHYYTSYYISDDYLAQNIELLRNNGFKYLLGNNYIERISKDNYRYYKVKYIDNNYCFHTGYPYTKSYTSLDIKDIIEKYGFNSSIPDYLLDTYNNKNVCLNELNVLSKQISKIKLEEDNMYMRLQIKQEFKN